MTRSSEPSHAPDAHPRPRFAFECETCGATSENELGFQTRERTRGRKTTHCLPCAEKANIDADVRSTRWALGLAMPAAALLFWAPDSIAARFAAATLNFMVLPTLLLMPMIAIHELGHFAVARLLGLRVHRVEVGVGRLLWRGHWGEVPIEWRRHPILGRVLASPTSDRFARLRFGLVTAAGPATHVVWILGAWSAAGAFGFGGEAPLGLGPLAQGVNPLVAIIWVNGLALVLNLIPGRVGELASDGAVLLALPFMGREQVDALVEGQWVVPAEIALSEGDVEAAAASLAEGLQFAPDSLMLQALDAARQSSLGDQGSAVASLRRLRAREGLEPPARAALANGLAWCLCLVDDPADAHEREALTREAERWLGENPAVLSTRGAVLLCAGRPGEAWTYLDNALSKVEAPDHRASVLCNLARTEHRLGLAAQANERLAEARDLNPRNELVSVTTRELSRPPEPPAAGPVPPRADDAPADTTAGRSEPADLGRAPVPAPPKRGLRLPAWLWVGAPALLMLWSCGPPIVESVLIGSVPYPDIASEQHSEEDRIACREGLATLDRWGWLLDRMPHRQASGSSWQIIQRVQLHACADQLTAARALLVQSLAASHPELHERPDDSAPAADDDADWRRYAALLASLDYALSLVRIEDRMAEPIAATASLERADALARRIDLEFERARATHRGRVARLAAQRIEQRAGPKAALDEVERRVRELAATSGESEEDENDPSRMLTLMNLKAELLDRLGRAEEADVVWARIGRATHAMGQTARHAVYDTDWRDP